MADQPGIYLDMKDVKALAESLDVVPAFKDGLHAAGLYLKGRIAEYPAASSANTPKPYPGRWYQRGYGTRWTTKGGVLRGRKTSETLSKRWTTVKSNGGMIITIGNNAKYARYVHSAQYQARFHKSRGWITDADAVEKYGDEVLDIVFDFISAKIDDQRKPGITER